MSDNYINQAWSLANEYFHSNGIDASKLVDHELVRAYLKACQKSTPKGVSISKQGNRLYLRFKTATKPATANNGCNESFTRDGCVNALAKALSVSNALGTSTSESEFWEWYEGEVKGVKTLENDIITIGQAVEIVESNYFNGYDKRGRSRNDEKSKTNSKSGYHQTYGAYYSKLNPSLSLTAENLISEIMRNWEELYRKKTKGFKNAYTACLKLLRDTKQTIELDKITAHFGTIQVTAKTKEQAVDIETFLDFRARVLGLEGYELTKLQMRYYRSRQSWFKAFCINLVYGFRASEFKAIRNLDEAIKIDGCTFKALHDPANTENILVLDDGFWVTDTAENRHWITIKTGERLARPMLHPSYPDLVAVLRVKDPEIGLPVMTPSANSSPKTIKECYTHGMSERLRGYIKQVGGQGFTQTHALRHLANMHGKLSGLTRDQRALSLGHSAAMNDKYDKHQTMRNQVNLLMADITEKSEVQRLKEELQHAQERILFLERENAQLREQLGVTDKLHRIK